MHVQIPSRGWLFGLNVLVEAHAADLESQGKKVGNFGVGGLKEAWPEPAHPSFYSVEWVTA